MTTTIRFKSSNGQIVDVPIGIAKRSLLVQTEIQNVREDETFDATIPLPNVRPETLEKVIEFATHHKDDPIITNDDDAVEMTDWDKEFLKVPAKELTDLIRAAEDLEMRDLLLYACRVLSENLSGKSVSELKEYFKC
ncbi:S-phase kinase-associated protein 1-like [Trichogramma pretiosum]|uniref:S-phase kinase-associated protein 1-like n=1 Tax=Trichogramma pretiosum TaxID=7493 RepID=UPI0006C93D77|nr:S-phase kinase-associated protein 1-like [Trichogramma pretiosum]